ncbi:MULTISPECIES: DEAD/DEAH box helicase [Pseudoalteromonas]|uniref:DEAD-box ATP-dependent RNA helicase RhpA n=1 Tax=Pseudoalteromonas amylolytica TaxID=1859457 RepID=A0A1S1MZR2_9GAMM|nr:MULTISPECIES: DEAD/DEAH box helicase [Pseudoalteromonas]OHU90737.1 ATP-dependent RNA helicase RhlE [Pseudoalteromonas sp. JW3]OHU92643.1 ATP-dependent RNA helicase RhlE [Pseudoalteromonas amylolytica]
MTFSDLGLSPEIVHCITEKGYSTPTPIQAQGIPAVLSGKDVMAAAQTGTGKTAAFTLPIIEQLLHQPRPHANQALSLVLAPTRELALQIAENVEAYSQGTRLRSAVVYGGVKINPQMMQLRKGVDILIATPGRLLDLYSQNAVKFNQLRTLVLDEADRMLDMGFIHDIKKIIKLLPKERQNLLFSATFSEPIQALAKGLIIDPVEISVTPKNAASKTVTQFAYGIDKAQKTKLLSHLIRSKKWQQVLVFCRTKHGANRLVTQLERDKISGAAIHGNKSQAARVKALNGFKTGEISVLVATDIVARGLDIAELPYVVNYDLPNIYEDYVHRIGRTGRAGSDGLAVSFVTLDDAPDLYGIERFIGALIPRAQEPGFEPTHPVPEKALDTRPVKAKKPKKPKKPKPHQDHQAVDANKRQQNPAAKKGKPAGSGNAKAQRVRSAIDNPTNAKPKRRRFKPKPNKV